MDKFTHAAQWFLSNIILLIILAILFGLSWGLGRYGWICHRTPTYIQTPEQARNNSIMWGLNASACMFVFSLFASIIFAVWSLTP